MVIQADLMDLITAREYNDFPRQLVLYIATRRFIERDTQKKRERITAIERQ